MARKIKNPRTDYIDPGITLFYPQDPRIYLCPRRQNYCSGRSSDFPAPSAAFPSSIHWDSGAQRLKRFPSPNGKGRGYSGGPVPDYNGVPFYAPCRAPELIFIFKLSKKVSQEKSPASRIFYDDYSICQASHPCFSAT